MPKTFTLKRRKGKVYSAIGAASASSAGAGEAFACSAGAAISLDLRMPTCLSGATSFAWL
jgi:hypothetical protein